jgi:hypothetical protein
MAEDLLVAPEALRARSPGSHWRHGDRGSRSEQGNRPPIRRWGDW